MELAYPVDKKPQGGFVCRRMPPDEPFGPAGTVWVRSGPSHTPVVETGPSRSRQEVHLHQKTRKFTKSQMKTIIL